MLKSNIHELDDFLTDHILENQFALKLDKEITHSFVTRDDSHAISVTNGIIESVTCYRRFWFHCNIIGISVEDFSGNLIDAFGEERAKSYDDNYVEYDNGDIQHDVNFDELNIFVTVDEGDVILSVTIYSD